MAKHMWYPSFKVNRTPTPDTVVQAASEKLLLGHLSSEVIECRYLASVCKLTMVHPFLYTHHRSYCSTISSRSCGAVAPQGEPKGVFHLGIQVRIPFGTFHFLKMEALALHCIKKTVLQYLAILNSSSSSCFSLLEVPIFCC